MKIRKGFVSNSSSSSFIVIQGTPTENDIDKNRDIMEKLADDNFDNPGVVTLPNSNLGINEFGWENTLYEAFGSKLNFCALQILYVKEYFKPSGENEFFIKAYAQRMPHGTDWTYYFGMLKDVCKSYLGVDIELREDLYADETGYIDHQSCAGEGENMEMFENRDTLINFLFSPESHVHGGNDND